MTREERIKVAHAAAEKVGGIVYSAVVAAVVDALFPRKLNVVEIKPCVFVSFDGTYRVGGRGYPNLSLLVYNWLIKDDDTLKALLALRDNPWEE